MRKHSLYGMVLALLATTGLAMVRPHHSPIQPAAGAARPATAHPVGSVVQLIVAEGRPGVAPRWGQLATSAGPALRPVVRSTLATATTAAAQAGRTHQEQVDRFVAAVRWQQAADLIELHDLQVLAQAQIRAQVQPAPAPAPAAGPAGGGTAGGAWAALRQCESGGNYAEDTGNGYYGAYQFSLATWHGLGYPGYPNQASPAVQDAAAQQLQARSGWGQWPACSAKLGL